MTGKDNGGSGGEYVGKLAPGGVILISKLEKISSKEFQTFAKKIIKC